MGSGEGVVRLAGVQVAAEAAIGGTLRGHERMFAPLGFVCGQHTLTAVLIWAASDPNWFYSTLAQSTAAIVGLAGGFLAQRLISQRTTITEVRTSVRSKLESFLRELKAMRESAYAAANSLGAAWNEGRQLRATGHNKFPPKSYDELFSLSHAKGNWGAEDTGQIVMGAEFEALPDAIEAAQDLASAMPFSLDELAGMLRTHGIITAENVEWLESPVVRSFQVPSAPTTSGSGFRTSATTRSGSGRSSRIDRSATWTSSATSSRYCSRSRSISCSES